MPTYEYECEAGHRFEKVQRMTDDALKTCEVCDAPAERLISASSFILKGGGWYVTDYARKGDGSKPEESAKASTDSGGSTSGGASSDAGGESSSS